TRPPTSVGSSLRTVPANTQVAAVQAGSAVVAQHTVGNQKNVILQQQHNLSARDRAVTVQMSSLNQHATVAGSLHGTAQDWVTRFLQSIGAK
ncbi:MAG: hypothetical protein ACREO5_00890, partial [Candidatus Binatia bacterium]